MDNAAVAAQAVNTYRQSIEAAFNAQREDLRTIAEQSDRAREVAADSYHAELATIEQGEAQARTAANERCRVAREAALTLFTETTAELHHDGPQ